MRILLIACSGQAYVLMKKLERIWQQEEPDIEIFSRVKCSHLPDEINGEHMIPVQQSLREFVGEWFHQTDAIIFLCAAGIAVRSIAPYITHKSRDPAVVVVDETAAYSIPLLSGHTGGANELAGKIGNFLEALPVITTATDREGIFAADVFARKNNLAVSDWQMAKKISAYILAGQRIGIYSELPVEGELPPGLEWYEGEQEAAESGLKPGIYISHKKTKPLPFEEALQLIPKIVIIGIGCRKNTGETEIAEAVESCLAENSILYQAAAGIASIDLKREEQGIISYCKRMKLPFFTYSPELLKRAEGSIAESEFVMQITGVSNVCERSALAAGGELLCGKKIYGRVTAAIAVRKGNIRF